MAVLVSGASGFLGSRLVKRLAAEGREVVALGRRPVPEDLAVYRNVRWLTLDLSRDRIDLSGSQIDAVVHLAGATLGAGTDEGMFLRANEESTVRLFQELAPCCEQFVFASSQVVYGDACHLAVTEDFPLSPIRSAYACSKVNSENWLHWFQQRHGGRYLALRFCGFIDGGGIVDYMIDRALLGEPIKLFSHGKIRRDYLPSSEGIDALVAALDYRGDSGVLPVNIGSGQAVSAADLARAICSETESSSPIELSADPSPQGDFVLSIDRARNRLGFRPGELIEAVRQYARLRKQGTGGG